ncbi:response regulator [Caulobacter segnis]|uniref:response regulator transcription factor n=1 Tax=Caulobacter segnis TaxID=88688 RepID=UPI00240EDD8F|nr:response regulator [Caulobacter segnis]MDG2520260.1 response regulator [Caulobacter segnis]
MYRNSYCAIVVDDDAAVLASIRFVLETEGLYVQTYDSVAAVLEADLPEQGCLILDQVMPGATGLEVLAQLRRRGVDLPALLLTSSATPAVRRIAEAAGAPVLEKPVFGETLVKAFMDTLAIGSPTRRSIYPRTAANDHSPLV